MSDETADVHHVGGLPWWEAPLPHRWHRCKTQTFGWLGLDCISRCACGAISLNGRSWLRRNERRSA